MHKVLFRLPCLLVSISLLAQGCGEPKGAPTKDRETPPATTATEKPVPDKHDDTKGHDPKPPAKSDPQSHAVTETGKGAPPLASTNSAESPAAEKKPSTVIKPFTEAEFLADDVVGIVVLHPKSYFETPMGRLLVELGFESESGTLSELLRRLGLKFADLDRVTVAIDQPLVTTFARQAGLPVLDAAAEMAPQGNLNLKNSLKQIGLAFHNYHDTYRSLPRVDGDAAGQRTGLSWRVHLLPFLEQAELYDQFHRDEAWDSEHNRGLISQMPPIFQSPGVTEEGKTSFQVFAGDKTLFHGESGIGFQQVTDGLSNTILVVLAGADQADIWTKPTGLEVDLASPRKALGDIPDDGVLILLADGSVRTLAKGIVDSELAKLIQPTDGEAIDLNLFEPTPQSKPAIPTTILALSRDFPKADLVKSILDQSTEETHEGQTFDKNQTTAVWFPEPRTVVVAPVETMRQIVTRKQAGKKSASPLIGDLNLASSLTAAIDLQSQASLVGLLVQLNPMLGMVSNIKTIALQFSGTGDPADPMVGIDVTALDASMAGGLFAIASMGLNQGKAGVAQLPVAPTASDSDKEMMALTKQLVASATLEQHDDKIHFRVPVPKNFDQMPEIMKPALVSGQMTARLAVQMNVLKEIGLAFHNYHDSYNSFPGAGKINRDKPVGLSWRVALLPYLNQAELYKEFKLDEAWDSDHNKALIEKMPAHFKSPGVNEPGKTSVHVFIGPGAPFADDATPMIQDFSDGSSNTILAVLAGPDKAEIWTKPGGLDFDPADPVKSLGELPGESFIALFADGRVMTINKKTDAEQVRRLIQIADGEPIQ